ncbi:MAG: response regulator [Synechococcaceae cyanobacterium SM2_3_1]|nr:response regulator [Synechococcaceae cyanobacterium SM2_3_1]
MISLVTMAGWQILEAESGREGIAMAEATQPDAILLDYMMPEMDGPMTLQQLQTNPSTATIPVIILTALLASSHKTELLKQGAKGLITKPFDPVKLKDEIAQILGWET